MKKQFFNIFLIFAVMAFDLVLMPCQPVFSQTVEDEKGEIGKDQHYTIKRITSGKKHDFFPVFSPDGKQIVFLSKVDVPKERKKAEFWLNSSFFTHLWIMDSNGENRRQLNSGEILSFSPGYINEGEKIIFLRYQLNSMWAVNPDGSGLAMVTPRRPNPIFTVVPSPDGKKIFFSTPKKNFTPVCSIWSMDINSGIEKRLTSGSGSNGGDWFPAVSPDSKEVAFSSLRLGQGDVWTIDLSGKNYNRLTFGDDIEFSPAWSPDGTKIAYVSKEGETFNVRIMDRDGRNNRRLTRNISLSKEWGMGPYFKMDFLTGSYYHLSWHPEGNIIAMTTWDQEKKESYITVIEFKKEYLDRLTAEKRVVPEFTLLGEKELTVGDWDDFGPTFHPDGNSIAFSSNRGGNWDIWSMNSIGEKPRRLTNHTRDEIAPVFSPDGQKIAFLATDLTPNSKKHSLWIMDNDGGEQARKETSDISILSYPAWHPGGNEIAFITEGPNGPEITIYSMTERTTNKLVSIVQMPRISSQKQEMRGMNYPFKEFLYRVDYDATGERIVFESGQSGNMEIWTIKRDGSDPVQITSGERPSWNPVFAPDRQNIAYATAKVGPDERGWENYNIWITDAETGEEIMVTGEENTDWDPAWSPDGKKIVYVTNRSGDFSHFNIWMLYLK